MTKITLKGADYDLDPPDATYAMDMISFMDGSVALIRVKAAALICCSDKIRRKLKLGTLDAAQGRVGEFGGIALRALNAQSIPRAELNGALNTALDHLLSAVDLNDEASDDLADTSSGGEMVAQELGNSDATP